jgi:hypothetical protein
MHDVVDSQAPMDGGAPAPSSTPDRAQSLRLSPDAVFFRTAGGHTRVATDRGAAVLSGSAAAALLRRLAPLLAQGTTRAALQQGQSPEVARAVSALLDWLIAHQAVCITEPARPGGTSAGAFAAAHLGAASNVSPGVPLRVASPGLGVLHVDGTVSFVLTSCQVLAALGAHTLAVPPVPSLHERLRRYQDDWRSLGIDTKVVDHSMLDPADCDALLIEGLDDELPTLPPAVARRPMRLVTWTGPYGFVGPLGNGAAIPDGALEDFLALVRTHRDNASNWASWRGGLALPLLVRLAALDHLALRQRLAVGRSPTGAVLDLRTRALRLVALPAV